MAGQVVGGAAQASESFSFRAGKSASSLVETKGLLRLWM